jgi:hypothetical protein
VELGKFTASRYNYSYSLTPASSDFSISGLVSITGQTLQYAYFMVNRTARLTCVGFTCTTCQTAASCLSQGGLVSGSQCVKCAANQVIVNGACACSLGLNLINGVCQACPQGTIYNTVLGTCSNLCTGNQVWVNGACQCSQGFSLINGQCQQVKCASNLFSYLGGCYACPPGSTASLDQSGCVCLPGYTFNSAASSCILPPPSPSPSNNGNSNQGSFSGNTNSNTFNSGGSSTNSSNSGTNGIYILPSGGNGGSGNSVPTNNPNINSLISAPNFACPTGAYFTNLTCRSQANLSVYQTAQLTGQSIVYVGIAATNLPNNLPSESYSYLLVPSVANGPQGTTVSIAASTFNSNQWIANINYVSQTVPITLSISMNSTYSSYFTATEMSFTLTTQIIPSQVAVYNIAITNSKKANEDVLTETPNPSIEDILNKK